MKDKDPADAPGRADLRELGVDLCPRCKTCVRLHRLNVQQACGGPRDAACSCRACRARFGRCPDCGTPVAEIAPVPPPVAQS